MVDILDVFFLFFGEEVKVGIVGVLFLLIEGELVVGLVFGFEVGGVDVEEGYLV